MAEKPVAPTYVGVIDVLKPFMFGGLAGMTATSVIQPLDCCKVRLQLAGEGVKGASGSLPKTFMSIVKNEGVMGLYAGYSAAMLRQMVYGTARLGLFRTFSDSLKEEGKPLPFYQKALCGLSSGAIASFIGNPADLSLVRMQADGQLPAAEKRNYKHAGDAISRIIREEGITTLWRGSAPTVYRAMAMNVGMLATYDQVKETLTPVLGTGMVLNMSSSATAGVVAATLTLPFDMLKTRIQKQVAGPDGTLPYKNTLDCARQILAKEGPMAFYKGWMTFCIRVAPHAIVTLLTMDTMNKTWTEHRAQFRP